MSGVIDLGPLIAAGSSDPALAATLAEADPVLLLPVRILGGRPGADSLLAVEAALARSDLPVDATLKRVLR